MTTYVHRLLFSCRSIKPLLLPQLFFHVSLVPQLIYKYVPGLALRALVAEPPTDNCLTQVIGADMRKVHFHHATPLLRATLCRRGECVPDVHNTVLMGMIHIKYHPEVSFLLPLYRFWNTDARMVYTALPLLRTPHRDMEYHGPL
jgi:hypothetical protein